MFTERFQSLLSSRCSMIVLACVASACLMTGCSSENSSSEVVQESRTEQPRRTIDTRAQTILLQADEAFQRGSYQRALALADSAEYYDPGAPVIPFFRGSIYTALNQFDTAQEAFQAALALDPEYPEAYQQMGDNAFRRGNHRESIRLYKEEENIAPTAELYERMGRAYMEMGIADSARLAYEETIQRDSTNANAHMMYGQLLEETGELETALQHSRRALDLQPGQPNFQFAVGSQLYQLGELQEAVEPLRQAADGQLLHYPAQYTLSQVLIRLGYEDEAGRYEARADSSRQLMQQITAAEEAASQNPEVAEYWTRLGELYQAAGEDRRAAEAFSRAEGIQSP